MIDLLHLRIPLVSSACIDMQDGTARADLHKYAKVDRLNIKKTETYDASGDLVTVFENHAFESLPSYYTGVAVCFRANGHVSFKAPFVEVKFSPAKILQGHNVFGPDSIALGMIEVFAILCKSWPYIAGDLDFKNSEVMQIDVTYSAYFESVGLVHQAKQALDNAGKKSIRKTRSYDSSVYWNQKSSHSVKKAYEKGPEVKHQISELKKEIKKFPNNELLIRNLRSLESVLEYANHLLRFEASIKKRFLVDRGIPCNAFDLLKLEKKQKNIYQRLWNESFKSVFESLEGLTMRTVDEYAICEKIDSMYVTQSSSGRMNYRKARAVRAFYFEVKSRGLDEVKRNMAARTFYDNLNALIGTGLSRAFIQSLCNDNKNVIPFIRGLNINFDKQYPENFNEPKLKIAAGMEF